MTRLSPAHREASMLQAFDNDHGREYNFSKDWGDASLYRWQCHIRLMTKP